MTLLSAKIILLAQFLGLVAFILQSAFGFSIINAIEWVAG
jgi:hypothetical protein